MEKTTIRLYFPHEQGEIGLQQRATLVVNTPTHSIPTSVKVSGIDLNGEELLLCPKQKKDHCCVTKTLHEELFAGGAKVDVTFYCKGLNSGGCKTKKPSRVCLNVTLVYDEGVTKVQSSPFIVKGNRRQKMKRPCSALRESLSVTTVVDNPTLISEVPQQGVGVNTMITPAVVKAPPIANYLPKLEEEVPLKRLPSSSFYPVRRNSASLLPNPPSPHGDESHIVLPPIRQCVTPECFRYDLPVIQRDHNTQFPHSFYIQNGSYTPDDYSIPPDEEEDYHEQTESSSNHHTLLRPDLPTYYCNFKTENHPSNYFPRLERQERLESPDPKRRCLSLNDVYGYDSMLNKRFQFPL